MSNLNNHGSNPGVQRVAYLNEDRALETVRDFGHVRIRNIARDVWPTSPLTVAQKRAYKTTGRLLRGGFLARRINTIGGYSFVLSYRGAGRASRNSDVPSGYHLTSMSGPEFFKHAISTSYLIERRALGHRAFGAHAISSGLAPIGSAEFSKYAGRVPDGLVLVFGPERGLRPGVFAADWVEMLATPKSPDEYEQLFALARERRWLDSAERVRLDRVLILLEARSGLEASILRALKHYLFNYLAPDQSFLSRLVLVRCEIDPPLVWRSHQEITCAQLLSVDGNP